MLVEQKARLPFFSRLSSRLSLSLPRSSWCTFVLCVAHPFVVHLRTFSVTPETVPFAYPSYFASFFVRLSMRSANGASSFSSTSSNSVMK